jgi:hypothetical protein
VEIVFCDRPGTYGKDSKIRIAGSAEGEIGLDNFLATGRPLIPGGAAVTESDWASALAK